MTVSRIDPYPGIVGSVVLVCMPVLLRKKEVCGISGNGLRKLILLELGRSEYAGDCDIVVSCNAMPELV